MAPPRLLIVDDYDELREVIAMALSAEGFEITEARSGTEALKLLRESLPDLMILDIGLPDIDGVTVCEEARKFTDIPILMLTGDTSANTAARLLDLGATDYLRKPVALVELTARVRAALRDHAE